MPERGANWPSRSVGARRRSFTPRYTRPFRSPGGIEWRPLPRRLNDQFGNTMPLERTMNTMSFAQKVASFWSMVNKNGPIPPHHPEMSNCWIWEGASADKRYGQFAIDSEDRRQAHNVAFYLMNGRWPNNFVDHLCHVMKCVRIDHLKEVGTHKENCQNRAVKICKRGHPLADPNLYYYHSKGQQKRRCLACHELENQKARAKREALKAGT
jgi:hypothetical protein